MWHQVAINSGTLSVKNPVFPVFLVILRRREESPRPNGKVHLRGDRAITRHARTIAICVLIVIVNSGQTQLWKLLKQEIKAIFETRLLCPPYFKAPLSGCRANSPNRLKHICVSPLRSVISVHALTRARGIVTLILVYTLLRSSRSRDRPGRRTFRVEIHEFTTAERTIADRHSPG